MNDAPTREGRWERVFTVTDYHDCPRSGVVDFHGRPHAYEAEFDASDDNYTARYRLMEIEPALHELALEQWAIWLRWDAMFAAGGVSMDSPPALPQDRERYDEITSMIGDRLRPDPAKSVVAVAEFRRTGGGKDAFEVRWRVAAD